MTSLAPVSALLATVSAVAALALTACAGKDLNLGSNTTEAQPVSADSVSGTVTACPVGLAHPNVCCAAAPGVASACEDYPKAPFTACPSGLATYPDPRSCCPIDGEGACVMPPPIVVLDAGTTSDAGTGGGGGGGGCVNPCPPGWYVPPGPDASPDPALYCCQALSGGETHCVAHAPMPATNPSTCSVCACPACALEDGAACPCSCPVPDPTCQPSTCPVCPAGWQAPPNDPTECCRSTATGVTECFSQAGSGGGGSADGGPITGDATVPPPLDASPPVGCTGSGGACTCSEGSIGFTCAAGATSCTCTLDGNPTGTVSVSTGSADACNNPASTLTACEGHQ